MDTKEYRHRIDRHLEGLLPAAAGSCGELFAAARYATLARSKRLRPLLTLMTTEMLGGDIEAALSPAAALEFIHTYSLIHDDLPCMDDDDLRRGQPTVHIAYSEATAVLTGDFLLTYAFETLAKAPGLSAEQRIDLVATLACYSGGGGMVGGQLLDIAGEGQRLDITAIQCTHEKKTGALIIAAIAFGAIIAKATPEVRHHLELFGKHLGLLFQITDDLLNETASSEELGKPVHSDASHEKSTYVSALGLEGAKREAKEQKRQALHYLALLEYNTTSMEELVCHVLDRTH